MVTSVQRCDSCDRAYPELHPDTECECGGLLSLHHPPPAAQGDALRSQFDLERAANPDASGVWRFRTMVLPGAEAVISHPEGRTPLLRCDSVSAWCGVADLSLKHEGHNPTGSFKDRGMTVGITQARRIGATAVACASTGNTSASLASFAAQAGLPALVFMPAGKVSPSKLTQAAAYGARLLMVDGDFDACLRLARQAAAELGIYLLNSVNPFRIEGQKTIVLDLLQQRGWRAPDWIVFPAGNLGNTAAFGKALAEARAWGLIDRTPRLVAVQAAGAAPFAAAFRRGFDQLVPVRAETYATAIRIGHPASYERAVRAIRSTAGVVTDVSDIEIMEGKARVDEAGVGCEPASAAAVAGVRKLVRDGTIAPDDVVVAVLTGHLLKDPDACGDAVETRSAAIRPDVAAVESVLRSLA